MGETLAGTTILSLSGPGSNDKESVLCIPLNWSLTIRCSLASYSGHSFWEVLIPLQEIQLMYSKACWQGGVIKSSYLQSDQVWHKVTIIPGYLFRWSASLFTQDTPFWYEMGSYFQQSIQSEYFKLNLEHEFWSLIRQKSLEISFWSFIIFTQPHARAGYDTRSIFKQSLTFIGWELRVFCIQVNCFLLQVNYFILYFWVLPPQPCWFRTRYLY